MSPSDLPHDAIAIVKNFAEMDWMITPAPILRNVFLLFVFRPIQTALRAVGVDDFVGDYRSGAWLGSKTTKVKFNANLTSEIFRS